MTTCLFCRISSGDVPADFVYQDTEVFAIRDINPQAAVHVLVIPRKHIGSFGEAGEEDERLIGKIARVAAQVARQESVAESGYRCVVNSGSDAQQTVPHLHLHVLGGRHMTWPPG